MGFTKGVESARGSLIIIVNGLKISMTVLSCLCMQGTRIHQFLVSVCVADVKIIDIVAAFLVPVVHLLQERENRAQLQARRS